MPVPSLNENTNTPDKYPLKRHYLLNLLAITPRCTYTHLPVKRPLERRYLLDLLV